MPTGTAVLVADSAEISCFATQLRQGTGVLIASPAVFAARAAKGPFGNLVAAPPVLAGVGFRSPTILAVIAAGPAQLAAAGRVDTPDTGVLVASPATLVATGKVGHVGIGMLEQIGATLLVVASKQTSITGNADIVLTPVGQVARTIGGTAALTLSPTGILSLQNILQGTTDLALAPTGSLTYIAGESAGLEGVYEATGKRASLPTLAYLLDATLLSQVTASVPVERSFLVPPWFVPSISNPFSEAGAGPDYIGTHKKDSLGVSYAVFRKPVLDEVIWYVPDNVLYRYEYNRDTKVLGWKKYLSLPQRALAGQFVFSMFDPEKVYDYYALIWGGLMWRWAYDTSIIAQQVDPTHCASFYLGALAAQWGYDLPADETLPSRRSLTANAVPFFKFKGLTEAVRLRLRALGFSGYANEIWVNPDNINNASYYPLVPLNKANQPSTTPDGAGVDYIERPHGYDNNDPVTYWPSSRLALHVNENDGAPIDFAADPVKVARILRALRKDVVPAHVDIRFFSTDHSVNGVGGVEGITVGEIIDIYDVEVLGDSVLVASGATLAAAGTVV